MTDAAVVFEEVTCERGGRRVVGPLAFTVAAGETVVLLGASGSGKTTTLRLVNRLLPVAEGTVRVQGRPVNAWDPVRLRRGIGYVIQEIGLFPHFTVAENVELVPRLEGWTAEARSRRVDELLHMVGLAPEAFRHRMPHELSGGQRQRVGVARALAADPPILLCDEPFGAVDPVTRADLQQQFHELTRRLRRTVLFVTHDVREALRLGDRIVLLEHGVVRFAGTPGEFRSSEDATVRAFRALL